MIQSEIKNDAGAGQEFLSGQTPLMQQYAAIKQEFQDALLFFQVGDFYELFYDDAKRAAAVLGIALTARGKQSDGTPIPLCGVPLHTSDFYTARLIKAGFKVAICTQLEPAVPGKVVARGVTQVLTPGTLISEQLLEAARSNYLLSLMPLEDAWALVFSELLTAHLIATVIPAGDCKVLEAEITKFMPDEVLIPADAKQCASFVKSLGFYTSTVAAVEQSEEARLWIEECIEKESQEQLALYPAVEQAVCQLHTYLSRTQHVALSQFKRITFYNPATFVRMDAATQRNLELFKNAQDGSRKNTLWEHIDNAVTPMGTRQLKKWLTMPLLVPEEIVQRQDAVTYLIRTHSIRTEVEQHLKAMGDIERVVGRLLLRRGQISDFRALLKGLSPMLSLVHVLKNMLEAPEVLTELFAECAGLEQLQLFLSQSVEMDEAHSSLIKIGFDAALDRMREVITGNTRAIEYFEKNEQELTGIASLKVRYNQVHGYTIEITKSNLALVPSSYMRVQTLAGKERYTTLELKRLEHEYLNAVETIKQREEELVENIKNYIYAQAPLLRKVVYALGQLDGYMGLALTAQRYGYVRPHINQTGVYAVTGGKHPIISAHLEQRYIANDVDMNPEYSLIILTGPNMGGKSTYLRQVAHTSLLMQIGSYVPAVYADVPIVDQIFTRVGAGDDVASGKSTFLVEMEEAAYICAQATAHSLIILDEVGRGTSTHDGMAIAQAILEYIKSQIGGLCLFATHYHELAHLSTTMPGIKTMQAACAFTKNGITLLYKIIEGAAQASFGIEVARRAQLPAVVVKRAAALLDELERNVVKDESDIRSYKHLYDSPIEVSVPEQKAIIQELAALDLDDVSPRQALALVQKWHALLEK
jgi:DNA mismatch repair protein MutS